MEETDVVRALAALAHPLRLRTFRALVVTGPPGLTPGVMQQALAVPAATLSFHLKELAAAGLVAPSRAGRHLVYRADYARTQALLGYLTEHCCQGAACAIGTRRGAAHAPARQRVAAAPPAARRQSPRPSTSRPEASS